MKKGTPDWNLWQTVFLVPIIVLNVQRGEAIDAAHAQASAIFRLTVTLVCIVGSLVVLILRSRAGAAIPEPPPVQTDTPPSDGRSIPMRYESTRDACWRTEKYLMLHHPGFIAFFLVFGLMSAFVMAEPISKQNPMAAYIAFPFLWLAAAGAWAAIMLGGVWGQLQQRFPEAGKPRVCTTSLTPEGVVDEAPDKITALPWKKITAIRQHDGDIYFLTMLSGVYIPASAFASPESSRLFHSAAVTLWKSRGAHWERTAAQWSAEAEHSIPAG